MNTEIQCLCGEVKMTLFPRVVVALALAISFSTLLPRAALAQVAGSILGTVMDRPGKATALADNHRDGVGDGVGVGAATARTLRAPRLPSVTGGLPGRGVP